MQKRNEIEQVVRHLAPRIPPHEMQAVIDHAVDSKGLHRANPDAAAWLSLVAYVRHQFTDYDMLLEEGYERDAARFFVRDEINTILGGWGAKRQVSEE
jgi:hypothetical protein